LISTLLQITRLESFAPDPTPKPFNYDMLWLFLAVVFGAAVLALTIWRCVVMWRERIADKELKRVLKEEAEQEKKRDSNGTKNQVDSSSGK